MEKYTDKDYDPCKDCTSKDFEGGIPICIKFKQVPPKNKYQNYPDVVQTKKECARKKSYEKLKKLEWGKEDCCCQTEKPSTNFCPFCGREI